MVSLMIPNQHFQEGELKHIEVRKPKVGPQAGYIQSCCIDEVYITQCAGSNAYLISKECTYDEKIISSLHRKDNYTKHVLNVVMLAASRKKLF